VVRLSKKITRLKCPKGHDLNEENRRPDGTCRACVRIQRGWRGNKANIDKTHCVHGHPYSGANLGIYKRGNYNIRYCRTCRAIKAREYYLKFIKPEKHPGPPGRPRKYE
jgi:hypothetical protein